MTALRPIEPIDTRGLTARAPSSGLPIFELVDPRTLVVDPAYQRSISERSIRLIRRIVEHFDWTKFRPPVCAFADDGAGQTVLKVIDGQHSAIGAASNSHVDKIPIQIVEAPDTRAQAQAFIGQNADRVGMTAPQMHVAAVAAGDDDAIAIERACERATVTVLRHGRRPCACCRRAWSNLADRDAVAAAIEMLIATHHCREVGSTPVGEKGGRPSVSYAWNPALAMEG